MNYVLGFVTPVPTGSKEMYRKLESGAAQLFNRCGAKLKVEGWGHQVSRPYVRNRTDRLICMLEILKIPSYGSGCNKMNNQAVDVPCLECGAALYMKAPLDDRGHWARDGDGGARLEYDKDDSFYRCLHCGTKNVVVSETSPFDVPQLKITHVKKDG